MILQIGASPSQPARQWSAGFELRGTARAGELDLTSPLGTLVAQARWQPGMVELSQGAERLLFASLPDLARQLLGETVPLEALFDWLRGRPEPQAPHEVTAAGFLQQGWDIDLTGLAAGTFTAKRSSEPTITLRARLEGAP
jgi:outer membrane lipoprotein LolB